MWPKLWPWLLILLLSLIPLFLFYRLLQDERWRPHAPAPPQPPRPVPPHLTPHPRRRCIPLHHLEGRHRPYQPLPALRWHARHPLSPAPPAAQLPDKSALPSPTSPPKPPTSPTNKLSLATDPLESNPHRHPPPRPHRPACPPPLPFPRANQPERLAAQTPSTPNSPLSTSSAAVPPTIAPLPSTGEAQPNNPLAELHDAAAPGITSATGHPVQLSTSPRSDNALYVRTDGVLSPRPKRAAGHRRTPLNPRPLTLNPSAPVPTTAAPTQSVSEEQATSTPAELHQAASPDLSAPVAKPVQLNIPALAVSPDAPSVSVDAPAPAVHDSPALTSTAPPAPSHAQQGTPSIPTTRTAQPTPEALAQNNPDAGLPQSLPAANPIPTAPATNRVDLPLQNLASANSAAHRPGPAPLPSPDLPASAPTERAASKPTSLSSPAPSATATAPPALPSITQPTPPSTLTETQKPRRLTTSPKLHSPPLPSPPQPPPQRQPTQSRSTHPSAPPQPKTQPPPSASSPKSSLRPTTTPPRAQPPQP